MASILKISDGTTTVDFLASAGTYRVTSWAPAVAGRRASALGGRGPYEDVVETMEIAVSGSTAAASIETLRRLLDQATRWGMGEPVAAVVLSFKPTASSDELKATILGPAEPGDPMIELPPNIVNAVAVGVVEPVILRFRRTGVWLGATVSKTSAGLTSNPVPNSVTGLTSMDTDSPYVLRLENLPGSEDIITDAFVVVTTGPTGSTTASRVYRDDAKNFSALASQYTQVADSGKNSVTGTVLKYTCETANTIEESDPLVPSDSTFKTNRRYAAFINRRNNSASATFRIRLKVISISAKSVVYTPWVTVKEKTDLTAAKDPGDPLYMLLGVFSTPASVTSVTLQIMCDTVGATMSFDSFAMVAMDNEVGDRAVAILRGDGTAVSFTSPTSEDFDIDHRLLTDPTGAAYYNRSTKLYQEYQGDPSLWLPAGHTVVHYIWLGTGGPLTGRWRAVPSSGTVSSNSITVIQHKAYLIPR